MEMERFSGGQQETSLERQYGASIDATYRSILEYPEDITPGRLQEVIFERPVDISRWRPQCAGSAHPLALHIGL